MLQELSEVSPSLILSRGPRTREGQGLSKQRDRTRQDWCLDSGPVLRRERHHVFPRGKSCLIFGDTPWPWPSWIELCSSVVSRVAENIVRD